MCIETAYDCYYYTNDDNQQILQLGEKIVCEQDDNRKFTRGDDSQAPGCGKCRGCLPSNIYLIFNLANDMKT